MPKPVVFRCVTALFFASVVSAQESHLDFRAGAEAAYQRKDYVVAREALLAALELQPDSPRYLRNLAAVTALAGKPADALDPLRRLAALGVTASIERDPAFGSLQANPEFRKILNALADNRGPQGEAEVFAELPGRTGVIEGIAVRERTGDIFLGDAHHRAIWRRDHTGQVLRFTPEEEDLFGIYGLALDERRDALWAATTALPAMSGYSPELKGQAALAEFELSTGKVRRLVPVPIDGRDHALGDLTVALDGTVYITDSLAPVIWQYSPGGEDMEKIADSPLFYSLQGIVLFRRTLFVADYAHGLFAVDLDKRSIARLPTPARATLVGVDGMIAVPGGIVAVQNGVEPQRVIRISLSEDLATITGVSVLAAGLPDLADLGLITMAHGRPTFIAGAGWDGFDPAKKPQPSAHSVRIFQVGLP